MPQSNRFRALEAGRYLLRATNTGLSGIIDHNGKILQTIPAYEKGVVKGTISILSGTTPYVKYGNYEANAKKEGVIVTKSGLQYKEVSKGKGEVPKTGDKVKVHYKGTLIDGREGLPRGSFI